MKPAPSIGNAVLVCLIIGVLIWAALEKPEQTIIGFIGETFAQALLQQQIASLSYQPATKEISGVIRPEFEKQYGGSIFHISGPLSAELYQQILQQHISNDLFFGPVEGWQENPEYLQIIQNYPLEKLSSEPYSQLSFLPGEEASYEIRAMALPMGELRLTVEAPRQINHHPAYSFKISAHSSSDYSSIYQIDDQAESLVDGQTFTPLSFSLAINESARYGAQLAARKSLTSDEFIFWQQILRPKKAPIHERSEKVWPLTGQNMVSLPFYLRTLNWEDEQEHRFKLVEFNKEFEIRAQLVNRETLQTVLGEMKTLVIEPLIYLQGQPKTSAQIRLWLSDDRRKIIVKIEAGLKIGGVSAKLLSYKEGKTQP